MSHFDFHRPEADTRPAGGVSHRTQSHMPPQARRATQFLAFCVGLRPYLYENRSPVAYATGNACVGLRP